MRSALRNRIRKLRVLPSVDTLLDIRIAIQQLKLQSRLYHIQADLEIREIDNILKKITNEASDI